MIVFGVLFILVEHQQIPDDPAVTKKLPRLLDIHYGVALTGEQLRQTIQFLTRKLWYEEGLDSSLEQCLDDLLVYVDKRGRGKRTAGLNLHDKVRKALDIAASQLTNNTFDPLYDNRINS